MKKLFLLMTIACAAVAFADDQPLFSIGFEESEGYTTGELVGQNGWEQVDWMDNTEVFVINDRREAASGSQYIKSNPSGVNVQLNGIDFSESYIPGTSLLISAYVQAGFERGGQPMSVKFHCLGTSNRRYGVEIAEFNFNQDGSGNAFVSGKNMTFDGLVEGQYYEFGVQIDPATKTVEMIFVGDYCYEGEGMTYKSIDEEGCGSFPDGIRIYNGAGQLDEFSIEMVPEPAFFGLLAIAGLFFARKQR